MPSLTSVPTTCPAPQTSTVRQFPSTWLAPNTARTIRAIHATADPGVMNAEATSDPTGSWRRFATLVLAHPSTADCWREDKVAKTNPAAVKPARYSQVTAYRANNERPVAGLIGDPGRLMGGGYPCKPPSAISTTKVPRPCRTTSNPSEASSEVARLIVSLLTPY
jgi:hypothetical protein